MSSFRRKLMMQPGSTGESPEFIEFRYDKYVDTGVKMNSDLKVSLKIKFHSADKSANIIGRWGNPNFTMSISGFESNWYIADSIMIE